MARRGAQRRGAVGLTALVPGGRMGKVMPCADPLRGAVFGRRTGAPDISAQATQGTEDSRVPGTHGAARRAGGAQGPASEGTAPGLLPVRRLGAGTDAGVPHAVERLRRRGEFDRVFREGQVVASRLVVLRLIRGGPGRTRVGFAAGRQLGGAVVRNRVRRRWREVVRRGPPLPGGWDLVVVARAAGGGAPFASLVVAWSDVLRRAGLLGGGGREARSGLGRGGRNS